MTNIFFFRWVETTNRRTIHSCFGPVFLSSKVVARFGTHLAKRLDEVGGKVFFSKTVFFFERLFYSCYMLLHDEDVFGGCWIHS